MEMEFYRPQDYPKPILAELNRSRPLMVEIANRWMRGWPKRVKALLKSGDYLELLKYQTEQELDVYCLPGNQHLARHEIAELYGLSPAPPVGEITN
jgi:hypothetical protein